MRQGRELTRRTFLAGTASATGLALNKARLAGAALADPGSFPKGFLWGAATAAHQVEGNNVNSDAWVLEHIKPSMFPEASVYRIRNISDERYRGGRRSQQSRFHYESERFESVA